MATQAIQDILDTEVPSPSYALLPSEASPIRPDISFSRPSKAWRTSVGGSFISAAADDPRVSGRFRGLLVEAERQTNTLYYSADPSQWNETPDGGSRDSIFAETYAQAYATTKSVRQRGADPIPPGRKTVSCVVEKRSADNIQLTLADSTDSVIVGEVEANIENSSIASTSGADFQSAYTTQIPGISPNGSEVHLVEMHVADNSTRDGNSQYVDINPVGGSRGAIIHYAFSGVSEHTPFIPTEGTSKTKDQDTVEIFSGGSPEWFSSRGGTFVVEFQTLLNQHTSTPKLLDSGGPLIFTTGGNLFGTALGSAADVSQDFNIYERNRGLVTFDTSNVQVALNGVASSVASHNDDYNFSSLTLGSSRVAHIYNSITYYPQRLSETAIKALTV